ncbi:hypothetical protein J6590_101260, partial [Homalodisca vitripennis]
MEKLFIKAFTENSESKSRAKLACDDKEVDGEFRTLGVALRGYFRLASDCEPASDTQGLQCEESHVNPDWKDHN